MITLTPAENILRTWLIERARADEPEPVSYGGMANIIDPENAFGWKQGHPRYSRVVTALFHVNSSEVNFGRPMVGALVVSSKSSIKDFADLGRQLKFDIPETPEADRAFWQDQLAKSAEYWLEHDDNEVADSQYESIMRELATIKRMLRTLMHC